jgi:hypothetical protein
MHVILLALGLLAGVAGIALIGMDVPINWASFGNTLVLAATVAIVGGLILIGLSSAVRQLRRIAQVLEARPLPRTAGAEAIEPAPRVEVPVRAPAAAFEPRLDTPAETAAPPVEPPVQPVAEEPQVVAPAPGLAAAGPAAPELAATDEPAPVAAPPVAAPPPEAPPPLPPEKVFEAVWSGEPASRPREGVVATATHATAVEVSVTEERAAEPNAPEAVGIFKSGVIDGMAYTLYTDGSIEAELAQGTVKFASIDELRAYLAAREE